LIKQQLTLATLALLSGLSACGGGGNSTPAAATLPATPADASPTQNTTTPTFSYDKILGEYPAQQWDVLALAKILDSSSSLNGEYIQDMTTSLTENGQSYNITATGQSNGNINLDYNWNINTDGTDTQVAIFDSSGFQVANNYQQTLSDGTLRVSIDDTTWLASQGVEYVAGAAAQVTYNGDDPIHTLPIIYGDFTESGDIKTTGTQDFAITPDMLFEYWENDRSVSTTLAAKGSGTLTIDYASSMVSGSILLDTFYDYAQVLSGSSTYSQVAGIPSITMTLVNGTLDGSQIMATLDTSVVVTSNGTISGEGYLRGALFGPEGNEMAASLFVLQDNADTHSYFYWDTIGLILGR